MESGRSRSCPTYLLVRASLPSGLTATQGSLKAEGPRVVDSRRAMLGGAVAALLLAV